MSAITIIKDILNHKISDGRRKITCVDKVTTNQDTNIIMLYYSTTDTLTPLALGRVTNTGIYGQTIIVACRHNDFDKARTVAFSAIQYLRQNKPSTNIAYLLNDAPSYQGVDDRQGGYIYTFNVSVKGEP